MAFADTVGLFDFAADAVAAVAFAYLLYAETVAVHYPRFFRTVLVCLLVFAVTGPVIGTVVPAFIHAVHGIAALYVTVGLYGLLRGGGVRWRGGVRGAVRRLNRLAVGLFRAGRCGSKAIHICRPNERMAIHSWRDVRRR